MPPSASRSPQRRSYRSATRETRARETRERILAAASVEFVRSGYVATTMRAVASVAGVSVATVELVFRTKSQLLRAAIGFAIRGDAEPVPMLQRDWAREASATGSAAEFLAIVGRVLADSSVRSAGLVLAAFEGAKVDESMHALADQLRAQRAETAGWIVDGLIRRSSLRAEMTRDQAIDTIWLLMDPHGFCALTRDRGWTAGQFERWFADSVSRLLLATTETSSIRMQHPDVRHASNQTSPQPKGHEIMSEAERPSSEGHGVDARLTTPGAISYLHIPAADVRQAAAFYREVFSWKINNPDSDRPSFDDTSGHLSGAWISDHPVASEPGLLLYIYVDQVDETAARIVAHGGEIVDPPSPEGLLTVATFRDPAGNVIGLWHDTTR